MPKTRLARIGANSDGFCFDPIEMVFEDGDASCYLDERMVALTRRMPVPDLASSHGDVSSRRRAGALRPRFLTQGASGLQEMHAGTRQMIYWKAIRGSGSARLNLAER